MTIPKIRKRRKAKQLVSREDFSFDNTAYTRLKEWGLSNEAIGELEQVAWSELCFLAHSRSAANSKRRSDQLKHLRKDLQKIISKLGELDEYTWRRNWNLMLDRSKLPSQLSSCIDHVDEALAKKGKSGNVTTDLDHLAFAIAEVLINHSIIPNQYGNQFNEVVATIFQQIGEDDGSARAAIDRAWSSRPAKGEVTHFNWRPYSIEDLVERMHFGITNEEHD